MKGIQVLLAVFIAVALCNVVHATSEKDAAAARSERVKDAFKLYGEALQQLARSRRAGSGSGAEEEIIPSKQDIIKKFRAELPDGVRTTWSSKDKIKHDHKFTYPTSWTFDYSPQTETHLGKPPPMAQMKCFERISQLIQGECATTFEDPSAQEKVLNDILDLLQLPEVLDEATLKTLREPVDMNQFLHRVSFCNAQNVYLSEFVCAAIEKNEHQAYYYSALDDKSRSLVCNSTLYTVLQDKVITMMWENPDVFEAITAKWVNIANDVEKWTDYAEVFEVMKTFTIVIGAAGTIDEFHGVTEYDGSSLQWSLPVNIEEAIMADDARRLHDNANAGKVLSKFPASYEPNLKDRTMISLKGLISPDQPAPFKNFKPRLFERHMYISGSVLPEEWTDLYQTWNMAFVSSYSNGPSFLAKLVNPSVACYHTTYIPHSTERAPDKGTMYMWHRFIGLFMHITYEVRNRATFKARDWSKSIGIDFTDRFMTEHWGRMNLANAHVYERAVAKMGGGHGWPFWCHTFRLMFDLPGLCDTSVPEADIEKEKARLLDGYQKVLEKAKTNLDESNAAKKKKELDQTTVPEGKSKVKKPELEEDVDKILDKV